MVIFISSQLAKFMKNSNDLDNNVSNSKGSET